MEAGDKLVSYTCVLSFCNPSVVTELVTLFLLLVLCVTFANICLTAIRKLGLLNTIVKKFTVCYGLFLAISNLLFSYSKRLSAADIEYRTQIE